MNDRSSLHRCRAVTYAVLIGEGCVAGSLLLRDEVEINMPDFLYDEPHSRSNLHATIGLKARGPYSDHTALHEASIAVLVEGIVLFS